MGVCRLPFDPAKSLGHFERAFHLSSAAGNPCDQLLALAGIADCYFLAWSDFTPLDRWLPLLDELLQQRPVFPSVDLEGLVSNSLFGALLYREPQHLKLVFWEELLNALLPAIIDLRLRITLAISLANYYLWMGDIAKVSRLKSVLQPTACASDIPPLTYLMWLNIEASYLWFTGDFQGCHATVSDSLQTAASSGVHLLDVFVLSQGVYGALSEGNLSGGADFLQQMKGQIHPGMLLHTAHYHYLAGWEAALREELPQALEHARTALAFTLRSGAIYPQALNHAALALVLNALGKYSEAASSIAAARRIGHLMQNPLIETLCLLAEAWLALAQNEETTGHGLLRAAFALGKQQGYVNLPWWLPRMMAHLCVRALEADIEVEYVQSLVRKRRLQPAATQNVGDNWPWPLKVYTFGRFALIKDGEPVRFTGKVQQKPLHLLKMLIALGGKGVREEQLCDYLWPESDGDAAHSAFTSTLSRLRQMLGIEGVIHCQDGRVTLNNRLCWVDAWAFERKANEIVSLAGDGRAPATPAAIMPLADQALRYYQGHFLSGDADQPWALTRRERLRSKFLNLILLLGGLLETAQEWEKASAYYQRGLNMDEFVEDYYRQLIHCHGKLGRRAEALSVFRRCCKLFHSLGIQPSPQLAELARSIEMGHRAFPLSIPAEIRLPAPAPVSVPWKKD